METDERNSHREKAQLLLQRERELFDLRVMHEQLGTWLSIGQALPQILLVGSLDEVWVRLRKALISKLRLQRVLLLEVNPESLHFLAPAGPACGLPSTVPQLLEAHPWGVCNNPEEASNELGVAALAEVLGLHRFLWSRIGFEGRQPVLMAGGFDRAKASFHAPFEDSDAANFNNAAQQVGTLLANAFLVAELRREKDQLRQANLMIAQRDRELQEMELARRIQTALLPTSTDGLHAELDIAAVMLPADEVGGDYYDAALDRRGALWLTIGDVSGHGLTPGLVMMMAQTAHSAIRSGSTTSPTEMVVRLNRTLHENVAERLRSNLYMTFVALRYEGAGRFVHAGAHLQILLFRQGTGDVELLSTQGTWLGIEPDISSATFECGFQLELGDTLVLYTDGLPESVSPSGQMLDVVGLKRLATKHVHLPTQAMAAAIIMDVREWCADQRQDDMTVMVVRRVDRDRP